MSIAAIHPAQNISLVAEQRSSSEALSPYFSSIETTDKPISAVPGPPAQLMAEVRSGKVNLNTLKKVTADKINGDLQVCFELDLAESVFHKVASPAGQPIRERLTALTLDLAGTFLDQANNTDRTDCPQVNRTFDRLAAVFNVKSVTTETLPLLISNLLEGEQFDLPTHLFLQEKLLSFVQPEGLSFASNNAIGRVEKFKNGRTQEARVALGFQSIFSEAGHHFTAKSGRFCWAVVNDNNPLPSAAAASGTTFRTLKAAKNFIDSNTTLSFTHDDLEVYRTLVSAYLVKGGHHSWSECMAGAAAAQAQDFNPKAEYKPTPASGFDYTNYIHPEFKIDNPSFDQVCGIYDTCITPRISA